MSPAGGFYQTPTGALYQTPTVSPLTPNGSPAVVPGRPQRPPPLFSPDAVDGLHIHNSSPYLPSTEPPSPAGSFAPLNYPPPFDHGPPPPFGPGGYASGPAPMARPPVSAARRRRMYIRIGAAVCGVLLLIIITIVVGILMGWIHVQVHGKTADVSNQ